MKIIKYASIIFISVLTVFLLSTWLLQHSHSLLDRHTALQNDIGFCLWRYGLIAMIVIGWSYWIRALGHWRHWDADLTEMLIKKRLWVGLFFISLEIVLWWGQNT
jgi:hypothetical protein